MTVLNAYYPNSFQNKPMRANNEITSESEKRDRIK